MECGTQTLISRDIFCYLWRGESAQFSIMPNLNDLNRRTGFAECVEIASRHKLLNGFINEIFSGFFLMYMFFFFFYVLFYFR